MHKLSDLKKLIVVGDSIIGRERIYHAYCPLNCGHKIEGTGSVSIPGRLLTISKMVGHLKLSHAAEVTDDTEELPSEGE
jgi:hypothetical protein